MNVVFKKPVNRIVVEVAELDEKMRAIAGKEKVVDENGKEIEQERGIFGIFGDKKKSEQYAPIWKKFCEIAIESPDVSDYMSLTEEEVYDIRQAFFDGASQMRRLLNALKPSDGSGKDSSPA
jgi:hypothetical protein